MKPIKLLLVEDNLADTVLIQESLLESKLQLDIDVVTDGEKATDYLYQKLENKDEKLPDLIILDLNMPRKDGREVLKEIKGHQELCLIPVLVMTTSENEEDIKFAYRNHANSYISKPVDMNEFTKIITSINNFWLTVVKLPSSQQNQ
ncbi:response regulator [Bernardetia sp.]|uniref:response regulator n=1 Tax=Bernardetia sp. TaxID=1937974 RepID=UPI0025C374BA|nr:response regulator [Bernardetia sp.]